MIRGALVALLSLEEDMEVVAELERGDQILPTAQATRPDVAVVDIDLPGLDGLSAADQLHQQLPECRVLVLTGLSQPGNLLRALKVHVRGFIVKDAPAQMLADGIRRVARGERVIDPDLVAAALETGTSPLTDRETDVLRQAGSGIPTDQIATRLSLSRRRCATTCPTPSPRSAAATASTPSASPATPAGSSGSSAMTRMAVGAADDIHHRLLTTSASTGLPETPRRWLLPSRHRRGPSQVQVPRRSHEKDHRPPAVHPSTTASPTTKGPSGSPFPGASRRWLTSTSSSPRPTPSP
jgi:two-component system, NarL family, response regulator DesR